MKKKHSRIRRAKPAFTLTALAAAMLPVTVGAADEWWKAYTYADDPGFVASSSADFGAAKASWETAEYLRSWGLTAEKASTAYALGYFGQGVTVGMIDSGHNLNHQEFQGGRFIPVVVEGVYGSSGFRYRSSGRPGNPFYAGESFHMTGMLYDGVATSDTPVYPGASATYNGGHGTAMLGILGANRDGGTFTDNMHGFAFGSTIALSNTGSTDSNSHGPYHDYTFMYESYKALVDAGAQVINSSWGTIQTTQPKRPYLDKDDPAYDPALHDWKRQGRDGGSLTQWYFRTLADEEFVHFYFQKAYGPGGHQYDPNNPGLTFLDAMYNAVKGTRVVHVRSAANQDQENPNNMAFYPYFNPDAEKHWISVGGLTRSAGEYVLARNYNEAGPYAKWWHMSAPYGDASTNDSMNPNTVSNSSYSTAGGTSGSSPHVTGALALLLSRYPNLDAIQARDVLFTTANNKKTNGVDFLDYWTAPDGEPDERYGWGFPDVDKGMYGPGQFLNPFTYDMTKASLDVWTNDIGQVAIKAREREDLEWLAGYKAQGIAYAGEYNLNDYGYGLYGMEDIVGVAQPDTSAPANYATSPRGTYPEWDAYFDASLAYITISQEDAQKWRKEWMDEKQKYIEYKIANGLYTASLTKQGPGRLVMTGENTYEGGTTVEAGELYGFTESFGTGKVQVDGGKFGVLATYNDLFTMKGALTSTGSRKADIEVNDGGTYMVMADNDVTVGALSFNEGARIAVGHIDRDVVKDAFEQDQSATGTVTATSVTGFENAAITPYFAFLDHEATLAGNVITGTLSPNDATYASYAAHRNGRSIGGLFEAAHQRELSGGNPGEFYDALDYYTATRPQVRNTLDSLGSDFYLNADNASLVNAVSITRGVKDQALGIGGGKTAKLGDTARLWATATGHWGTIDYGYADMDADSQSVLIGAEVDVNPGNTVGVFFGAGSSTYKAGRYGKLDSDDVHGGLYGLYRGAAATINYGLTYSQQSREGRRALIVGDVPMTNKVKPDAKIVQVFAEAAYTGLNTSAYSLEPYAGLNLMKIKTDGYSEYDGLIRTGGNSQSVQAGTLGLRGGLPVGSNLTLRGDLSAVHFFGDSTPEARMILGDLGSTRIKGGKLGTLIGVGVGLEGSIGKTTKLSVSYNGMFSGDVKSNGIFANLRIGF
ncbi:MAG: autotransporter domain-containing protein [Candidatus Accumulibacter sp.]|jgi:subtilase-type serine protease|nr:autotransporter domain-containing protein [Accumulibacter sp.]